MCPEAMETKACNLQVRKTSRRDLPVVMGDRLDGATTVSSTMLLAARAGIPVFVTGGLSWSHLGPLDTHSMCTHLTWLDPCD